MKLAEKIIKDFSINEEDMFTTEITFLMMGINNELSNIKNKNVKKIGSIIYSALDDIRSGNIEGAKKKLKNIL